MGMDVIGRNPSNDQGAYFRASIWAWRPLHALCEEALGTSLPWSRNDGEGLHTQDECTALANLLERRLEQKPAKQYVVETHDLRVDAKGQFIRDPEPGEGYSPYTIKYDHVQEFIKFLRACGGFQIF